MTLNQQDSTTLSEILKKGNFLAQANAWNSKILIAKVDSTHTSNQFHYYDYQSRYEDSNHNHIQDPLDRGFFNPASTVKVSLAALALEKLNTLGLPREAEYQIEGNSSWYRIDEDLRRSLVISDNEATNRLILWLGFDFIHQQLTTKGMTTLVIHRLMLDRGTLIASPAFNIRFQHRIIRQSSQAVSVRSTCHETTRQTGNCATALDLFKVLARIVQPESFTETERFHLRRSDQAWLKTVMSHTPRQEGFQQADRYCRFLTELEHQVASHTGKMLSKCGVALFSNTYVDSSFIETDAGEKYYITFAVTPPKSVSEQQILQWMNETMQFTLPKLS